MKEKTKKTVINLYLAYDFDYETEAINKRAREGWQLVAAGLYRHTYVKSEEEYRYAIDYNRLNRDSEEYHRYLDLQAEMGWELVDRIFTGWHYFRKKYVPGTEESDYVFYTDNESYREMLKKLKNLFRILEIIFLLQGLNLVLPYPEVPDANYWWTVALYVFMVLVMELGIIQVKCKRLGKKSKWTFGRISGYFTFFAFVVCAVGFFASLPLMFEDPVLNTKFVGNMSIWGVEEKRLDIKAEKSGEYELKCEVTMSETPVVLEIRKIDGTTVWKSGAATTHNVKEKIQLDEGNYYFVVRAGEEIPFPEDIGPDNYEELPKETVSVSISID